MDDQKFSPSQVNEDAQDFLRSKRNDNLNDFALHVKSTTDAITYVDAELKRLELEKRDKNVSKTGRMLISVEVAELRDLKRKLTGTRSELSVRLTEFRNKTVNTLNTSRLRQAAKDPSRRNLWKPALTKNLRKFPSEIQKKAQSAKMEHTKARWQPALADMKTILDETSVELQRDAAEKFIRKHKPDWAAKLSGDADYRTELLDVFLEALKGLNPKPKAPTGSN